MKVCKVCGSIERTKSGRECKQCVNTRAKKWAAENKEKNIARITEWAVANPEKRKAYEQKYRDNNKEKTKTAIAKWTAENIESVKQGHSEWKRANKDKVNASTHNRRAKLRSDGETFSADDIDRLMVSQKCRCRVCRTNIAKSYHIDHIMPVALGGANNARNLQLLCPTCNMSKGAKHPVEFMQQHGYLC